MYYKKYDIPSTDTSTTTDVAVEKDFGATGNEVLVVFANEDGMDQVLPLNSVIKNNILTSSVVVLSPASLSRSTRGLPSIRRQSRSPTSRATGSTSL